MNELDLLRELRADVPAPDHDRLAAGRSALLAAIVGAGAVPRRRSVISRHPRRALALAVATAVTAVVAVTTLSDRASTDSPTAAVPASRVTLAAEVLRAAAARLGSEPARRPAPRQWIYSVAVQAGEGGGSGEPNWMTFDGSSSAYYEDHRLVVDHVPSRPAVGPTAMARFLDTATPMTAYDALAALPRHPRALLAVIARTVAVHPGAVNPPGSSPSPHPTPSQQQFDFLATLLWNAAQAAPTRAVAAAYHALALIPGVIALRTEDALHRPAIALADRGGSQQLLIDPHSYRVTGLRTVSDGHWPQNVMKRGGPDYPRGTVIMSLAWAKLAFVSGPGRR